MVWVPGYGQVAANSPAARQYAAQQARAAAARTTKTTSTTYTTTAPRTSGPSAYTAPTTAQLSQVRTGLITGSVKPTVTRTVTRTYTAPQAVTPQPQATPAPTQTNTVFIPGKGIRPATTPEARQYLTMKTAAEKITQPTGQPFTPIENSFQKTGPYSYTAPTGQQLQQVKTGLASGTVKPVVVKKQVQQIQQAQKKEEQGFGAGLFDIAYGFTKPISETINKYGLQEPVALATGPLGYMYYQSIKNKSEEERKQAGRQASELVFTGGEIAATSVGVGAGIGFISKAARGSKIVQAGTTAITTTKAGKAAINVAKSTGTLKGLAATQVVGHGLQYTGSQLAQPGLEYASEEVNKEKLLKSSLNSENQKEREKAIQIIDASIRERSLQLQKEKREEFQSKMTSQDYPGAVVSFGKQWLSGQPEFYSVVSEGMKKNLKSDIKQKFEAAGLKYNEAVGNIATDRYASAIAGQVLTEGGSNVIAAGQLTYTLKKPKINKVVSEKFFALPILMGATSVTASAGEGLGSAFIQQKMYGTSKAPEAETQRLSSTGWGIASGVTFSALGGLAIRTAPKLGLSPKVGSAAYSGGGWYMDIPEYPGDLFTSVVPGLKKMTAVSIPIRTFTSVPISAGGGSSTTTENKMKARKGGITTQSDFGALTSALFTPTPISTQTQQKTTTATKLPTSVNPFINLPTTPQTKLPISTQPNIPINVQPNIPININLPINAEPNIPIYTNPFIPIAVNEQEQENIQEQLNTNLPIDLAENMYIPLITNRNFPVPPPLLMPGMFGNRGNKGRLTYFNETSAAFGLLFSQQNTGVKLFKKSSKRKSVYVGKQKYYLKKAKGR